MIKLESLAKELPENEAELSEESNFYTGRYLLSLVHEEMDFSDVTRTLKREIGLKVAHMSDFSNQSELTEKSYEDADLMVFEDIGIALLGVDPNQSEVATSLAAKSNFIMEPEEIIAAPKPIPVNVSANETWGIRETQVAQSHLTGKQVKVAVLDTGFDFNHPDFIGRTIFSTSFVPGESADDLNGHGTHCIGTACGNKDAQGIRYGVAGSSDIYVAKVLGGLEGRGTDSWILNAINWAVMQKCQVISMSLGSRVFPGQGHKLAYERAAKYALRKGSLVIAAAGNDSQRPFHYNPIGSPSNVPNIMAVAAVNQALNVARFSNRAINTGSRIEVSGPGVGVYSSWITSQQSHKTLSGTSMATPHVAGIAALYAEKYPSHTPLQLWNLITTNARTLNGPAMDYGAGLVMAP